MILLLGFAFLSGLVTILAPCIWPLLPIILSSSIAGNAGHRRPLGITLGIMLSFFLLTLFISTLIKLLHLDPNILRIVAVIIIAFFGISMIIPAVLEKLELVVSRLSGKLGRKGQGGSGFTGGFVTGLSLGIVWTPCAGPILATIATLAATGKVSLDLILVTFFYILGSGIPLFIFATVGQKLLTKTRALSQYTVFIQQIFGVIMILTAIIIALNLDTVIEAKLLNAFPFFQNNLNQFETQSAVTNQLNNIKNTNNTQIADNSSLFNTNTPAPDFTGINKWLNLPNGQTNLSLNDLKGKVVLVDFWTYSCINCIRTLPHVTAWYNKYKNDGFVVVGIHTPEFAFEHETSNVEAAIKNFGIKYPVGQDNDYSTWNAYSNQYWPAEYLIDKSGIIRREEFGEGSYAETEQAIQLLLKDAGHSINEKLSNMPNETPTNEISPETYLGSNRMQYLVNTGNTSNGQQNFSLTSTLPVNEFSFGGVWNISGEYSTSVNNSTLDYEFSANHVYIVMSPTAKNQTIKIFLDGKLMDSENAGSDVKNGVVTLDSDRLYNLVNINDLNQHLLHLELSPGIQVYTFTFG